MIIRVYWELYGRIACLQYPASITEADLKQAAMRLHDMMEASGIDGMRVHIIHDMSALSAYPTRLNEFVRPLTPVYRHPLTGRLVVIGAHSPLMRFLVDVTSQMFRLEYLIAETGTDALTYLQSKDATLPQTYAAS